MTKEQQEALVKKGQYGALAIEVANAKFKHWGYALFNFGEAITNPEKFNAEMEERKQAVKDLREKQDDLIIQNPDAITGLDSLSAGLLESIFNPFEMIANTATGFATQGMSVGGQVVGQLAVDTAQLYGESLTYEDRLPTASEVATNAVVSIGPDLVGNYLANRMMTDFANYSDKGDITVNLRKEAKEAEYLYDPNTKAQELFTSSPQYRAEKLSQGIDPYTFQANKYNKYEFITANVNKKIEADVKAKFKASDAPTTLQRELANSDNLIKVYKETAKEYNTANIKDVKPDYIKGEMKEIEIIDPVLETEYKAKLQAYNESIENYDLDLAKYEKELNTYNEAKTKYDADLKKYETDLAEWEKEVEVPVPAKTQKLVEQYPEVYDYLPEDIKNSIKKPRAVSDKTVRKIEEKFLNGDISYVEPFDSDIKIGGKKVHINVNEGLYDSFTELESIIKKQLPKDIQDKIGKQQLSDLTAQITRAKVLGIGNIRGGKISEKILNHLNDRFGTNVIASLRDGVTAPKLNEMEIMFKVAEVSDEFDAKPVKKGKKPSKPTFDLQEPVAPIKPEEPVKPEPKKILQEVVVEPKKTRKPKAVEELELKLANGKKINLSKSNVRLAKQIATEQTNFLNRIADNTKATVLDYSSRYEQQLKKGVEKPKVIMNYDQIETAINNQFLQYQANADYVSNEYVQLLGDTPKNIINKYGKDGTDIATRWLYEDFSGMDEAVGFENIYQDSIKIDELRTDINLDDFRAKESFIKKHGAIFDEDGEIKYDKSLLQEMKNATEKDRNIILGLVRESEEWGELLNKAKTGEIKGFKRAKWLDKELDYYQTSYDTRKRKARESVKLNQVVNKQKVLGQYDSYFTEKIDANNYDKVRVADSMKQAFYDDIVPFYQDGYFKMPEDGDYEKAFANFIFELKKTRRSARWEVGHRTMGSLREYFEDGKMLDFWTAQPQFLNSNADMINDIFDRQASDIARFKTFGSVSPFAIKNKVNHTLHETYTKLLNKGTGLNVGETKIVNKIQKRIETALENEFLGGFSKDETFGNLASKGLRQVVRQKILAFSGIAEPLQNIAMSYVRGQAYGGFATYKPSAKYRVAKIAKSLGAKDVAGFEYNIAQMRARTDASSASQIDTSTFTGKMKKVDSVTMYFQRLSTNQQLWLGEAQATKILDNLPLQYDLLENEMKRVFSNNGIDASNYDVARQYISKHIADNGLTVNPRILSDLADSGDEMAEALRTSYYHLSNEIGDTQTRSKFQTRANNELSEWYGMFKQFSKSVNKNTWMRLSHYVSADGMAKPRFSPRYFQEMGMKGAVKDLGLFSVGSALALAGGASWTLLNQFTKTDRTLNQRYALMQTNGEGIFNSLKELDVNELLTIAGANPFELMQGDSYKIIAREYTKVYDTFTDEEKKLLGTNWEEGMLEMFKLSANILAGDLIYKNLTSLSKDDIEDLDPKIFGLSNEQRLQYESLVRNYAYSDYQKRVAELQDANKRELDYLEGSLDSYNALPKEQTEVFERALSKTQLSEKLKDELRTEFPVIVGNTTGYYKIADKVEEEMDIPIREAVQEMEQENGFKSMNNAQKRYYKKILEYKGLEDTDENRDIFYRNFSNIKRSQLAEKLREVYNIDRGTFIKKYTK